MTTFISNVPLWVVPLFIVLLILGLRASKARRVPIYVLYALPPVRRTLMQMGLGMQ